MKFTISLLFLTLWLSCSAPSKKLNYSFFIAGHTYGSPNVEGKDRINFIGLHRPFKEKFEFINNQQKMTRGFLLGDIVYSSKDWKTTLEEIKELEIPIEAIRGNHDGNLASFEKKFGRSYKKFIYENDLYIILDTNIDLLNIKNEQLDFLKESINNNADMVSNIFIFSHHIFWYPNMEIPKPFPNSLHLKKTKGITNYWSTIEPILSGLNNNIFIFSGDVGAFSNKRFKTDISEYYYHEEKNIKYIATGMGAGIRDNFIIVDVFDDSSVEFRLVHLNDADINGLGKLEEYSTMNTKE